MFVGTKAEIARNTYTAPANVRYDKPFSSDYAPQSKQRAFGRYIPLSRSPVKNRRRALPRKRISWQFISVIRSVVIVRRTRDGGWAQRVKTRLMRYATKTLLIVDRCIKELNGVHVAVDSLYLKSLKRAFYFAHTF